ncbi:RNA polymerase sigma factor [Mucilaginibacter sp. OK283]|uniref:RNA polymerase sigma factor n=1 Tax=Mucilaginibacter sp. OK283 TaxID=1881049 RepID=UPI0008CC7601|nr:RNA polymerase sigma-70 factor [Mucilaginibacter sp. OK283]SEP24461.1 RNA polymerase sigma-70 factor, ECF subfamily [Mucilaginibacter sp. OK283]
MKLFEDTELQYLLARLHNNDERAFNKLYSTCFRPIYRRVFSLVKDEAVADELVQDLFLKLWQNREDIDPQQSFEAYLFTIAQHLVYDHFRRIAKNKRLVARLLLNATDYYLHSDILLETKESRELLQKAIDQLSPQRREVFTRCKIEGKTYEETGLELGISVPTVNSHMTQSMKLVREYLLKNQDIALVFLLFFYSVSSIIPDPDNLLHLLH